MQQPSTPATDPGFRVPDANAPAASSPAASAPGGTTSAGAAPAASSIEVAPAVTPVTDTSTRDAAIGSAAFLALVVVFFFVRSAFVHHLVVRRVAPAAALSAGWLLFTGLAMVSAAIVLAVVNAGKFLNWAVTGPLVIVGAVALIAAVFTGRR